MLKFQIDFLEKENKYMLYCYVLLDNPNNNVTHIMNNIIGYYDTFQDASLACKHKLRSLFGDVENDIGLYKSSDKNIGIYVSLGET